MSIVRDDTLVDLVKRWEQFVCGGDINYRAWEQRKHKLKLKVGFKFWHLLIVTLSRKYFCSSSIIIISILFIIFGNYNLFVVLNSSHSMWIWMYTLNINFNLYLNVKPVHFLIVYFSFPSVSTGSFPINVISNWSTLFSLWYY